MGAVRTVLLTVCAALLVAAPADARTFRSAATGTLTNLLNPFGSLVQGVVNPHALMHDALTVVSTDGRIEPGLAIGWESTGPTTWRIHLRPDVVYSNGRPFTAEAVVKTIAYLQSPDAQRFVISGETRTIAAVHAVDDLTLEIETTEPDVLLPKRLSMILIPEPWVFEDLGVDAFSLAPIGTGSYKLADWNLDRQRPVLVASDTSWRPVRDIDRVEVIIVKDAPTQVQALRTDEIDLAWNFGLLDLDALEADGYTVTVRPGGQIISLVLPNVDPGSPFADKRVRQAINYAVDKQAIADVIMYGKTRPAGQGAVPTMTGYNPAVSPYPYDPAKARALLAEAGYPDGFSFRGDVLIGALAEDTTMWLKVAQDLAAVGIAMQVQPTQGPQWISKYFTGDWGDADTISATWNGASYWDSVRALEIFSCKKPVPFFCLPEIMPSIDATHGMFDPVARDAALQSVNARYHDEAPSLFLVEIMDVIATAPWVGPLQFRHKQLAVDKLTAAD